MKRKTEPIHGGDCVEISVDAEKVWLRQFYGRTDICGANIFTRYDRDVVRSQSIDTFTNRNEFTIFEILRPIHTNYDFPSSFSLKIALCEIISFLYQHKLFTHHSIELSFVKCVISSMLH